jgi:hypothetical protein
VKDGNQTSVPALEAASSKACFPKTAYIVILQAFPDNNNGMFRNENRGLAFEVVVRSFKVGRLSSALI